MGARQALSALAVLSLRVGWPDSPVAACPTSCSHTTRVGSALAPPPPSVPRPRGDEGVGGQDVGRSFVGSGLSAHAPGIAAWGGRSHLLELWALQLPVSPPARLKLCVTLAHSQHPTLL